jgi:hypothetical protein
MSESTTRAETVAAQDAQLEYDAKRLVGYTDAVDHHISFDFQRIILAYDEDEIGGRAVGSDQTAKIHELGYVIDKIFAGSRPGFDGDLVVHVRRE